MQQPEPTPMEALQWMDEILSQVNMNRAQHDHAKACVAVLLRTITGGSPNVTPG